MSFSIRDTVTSMFLCIFDKTLTLCMHVLIFFCVGLKSKKSHPSQKRFIYLIALTKYLKSRKSSALISIFNQT